LSRQFVPLIPFATHFRDDGRREAKRAPSLARAGGGEERRLKAGEAEEAEEAEEAKKTGAALAPFWGGARVGGGGAPQGVIAEGEK